MPPAATPSPQAPDLHALMARIALGDRLAFRALYDASAGRLLGVVLRIQPDRAHAEELLQEVFVKVWAAARGFDAQRASPMVWLQSIARHAAIDSLRRAGAEPQRALPRPVVDGEEDPSDPLAQWPDDGPGPAELMAHAMEAQVVRGCLGGLQREQRQSLALAFYDGLSHAELARHLNQPLGTVKSWLRRGLQALQRCVTAGGIGGPARG